MNANHRLNKSSDLRRIVLEPLAMAAVIVVLIISGVVALRNFRELQQNRLRVRHTHRVLANLSEIEAAITTAESAQRGYFITQNEAYLAPFRRSIENAYAALDEFRNAAFDSPTQQQFVIELRELLDKRIEELEHVLAVLAREGPDAASRTVSIEAEKLTMDRIHNKAAAMRDVANALLAVREDIAARSYQTGRTTSIISTLIGLVLVGGVMILLEHNRRKAERDASELRTTRERLQLALDAAQMGSWNIDLATSGLMGDGQFRKIFGFQEGEITYQRAVDALHPEDRSRVEEAITASTRPNNPVLYSIEYRVIHADGSVHWVFAKGAAHFAGEGRQRKVSSFDGTVQDITARKHQEQRLQESEQAALAASKAKSEFLANMSHEIRTPMAAILGYADVLLGHLKDPDNRNCVLVMKRNGQHLLELINDILDLSRIEAGKLEVDLEWVSLPRLIADVQSLMYVRAEQKQLNFQAEFTSVVPESIRTDATRLRQVLINLIGNAIKFTEQGTVNLGVHFQSDNANPESAVANSQPVAHQYPEGNHSHSQTVFGPQGVGRLLFSVRDTGIGISQEQQQRLFNPFAQGDSSVTRAYGGSGLGLAISQRLIGMLGGNITLHSQLGQGSTFTIVLPIDESNTMRLVQPDALASQTEMEPLEIRERRLNCHVLVVDDRRDVRHISQHFLEKAGASVITAEDGQQGIDLAIASRDAGEPFDLIVMDMQMPNVDGLQATAQLRSAGIQWPILALTADAMKGDRDRCLDGGCDDYLSKPIDHARLVSMVAHYTQDVSRDELLVSRQQRAAALRASLPESHQDDAD